MKRYCYLFLILLLFPFSSVFAADGDYEIAYDITKFSIDSNGDTINFSGWSFLDHMDNHGDINMDTWILAYTGNWQNSWQNPDNDFNACSSSPSCYSVKANIGEADGGIYDIYYIRCTKKGCSEENHDNQQRKLEENQMKFRDNSCAETGNSRCIYYNVGFNAKLSINNIIAKIGNNKQVKFRIVTKVRYGGKKSYVQKQSAQYKVDSSDIGVVANSCTSVFGQKCDSNNKTYITSVENSVPSSDGSGNKKTKTRSVKIGGFSKKAKFTASQAIGYQDNEKKLQLRTGGKHFKYKGTYDLLEVGSVKDNYIIPKSVTGGTKKFKNIRGRLVKINRNGDKGYAWTAWLKLSGNLTLDLSEKDDPWNPTPPTTTERCPDQTVYCIGSSCKYYPDTCKFDIPSHANRKSYSCSNSVSKTECGDASYNDSCIESINDTYYYRLSSSEVKTYFPNVSIKYNSNYKVKKVGDYYYFPIEFFGNVKYSQSANLKLDFVNNKSVDSGRSFAYSYAYQVSSNWNYYGNYQANTTEDNTYVSYIMVDVTGRNNIVTTIKVNVALKEGDKLYSNYNNPNSVVTYNLDFYRNFVTNKAKAVSKDLNPSSNVVRFPDSNNSNSNVLTTDAGAFSCGEYSVSSSNWNAQVNRSVSCTYRLNTAYFKNDGSGEVIYHASDGYSKDINQGSLYYIPSTLNSSFKFSFQVSANSLSLVNKLNYSYTPTCQVVASNKIRNRNKVRYRSIDTSDPFPKSVPSNWNEYIKSSTSALSRITHHSFDAISYQTVVLNNQTKVSVSELKNTYGDYSSYNDIASDNSGVSAVIRNTNLFTKINGNHCKALEYSSSCDKVQGN